MKGELTIKKGRISIVGGLILGVVISYFVLDYEGWTLVSIGVDGETANTVNELDFDLITYVFGIILISIAVIYGVLAVFSKNYKANE
ncbi:hypothetical protein [Planococcus sp. ISL-110]|uniref:hypothetical protein n=1 Tax=Planococcus sp. ISL-110 TaxID=2819167 RepID=UPI0020353E59|nr:hypothetical protein [Planococcus sp. ISL-110]